MHLKVSLLTNGSKENKISQSHMTKLNSWSGGIHIHKKSLQQGNEVSITKEDLTKFNMWNNFEEDME